MAANGREVSPLENKLDILRHTAREVKSMNPNDKNYLESAKRFVNQVEGELFEDFIKSIHNLDSKWLFEVAQAVENLKKNHLADPQRAHILTIKRMLDLDNEQWTFRELADFLVWRYEDYPRLRRVCRELKFPLKPSRTFKNQK